MTPAVDALVHAAKAHRVLEVGRYCGEDLRELLAQQLEVSVDAIFKTLIVTLDEGQLVTAVLPLRYELNLKRLASLAGSKAATMAARIEAERATGYVLGGISPLGQRRHLATYADDSAFDHRVIYVSAGRRGLELEVAPADLVETCDATLGALARR